MFLKTKSIAAFLLLAISSSPASSYEVTSNRAADHAIDTLLASQNISSGARAKLMSFRNEFLVWAKEFGKVYDSLEEELERLTIWIENHEFISKHNNRSPEPSYTVGHNHFSDLTNDEFQQLHSLGKYSSGADAIVRAHKKAMDESAMKKLTREEEEHPYQQEFRYLRNLARKSDYYADDDDWFYDDDGKKSDDTPSTDDGNPSTDDAATTDDNDTDGLPDEIDWVKAGAVTPVKNQGRCGSCWAFSATGGIEGANFVTHGTLLPLSEQNLLDCDHVDQGCNGGLMDNAFKFDESAHGLCSEEDYPYLATDHNTCMTNCTKVEGSAVTDYIDLKEGDKHGLLASIVMQPTSIAMQADQLSFQFYSGGVFDDQDCGAEGAIDHGVLAVGYGRDESTGLTYFTVKNSWGGDWGENGYIRLHRDSKNEWGTCAILRVMTAPIVG
jgi:C1A family cysteine protease